MSRTLAALVLSFLIYLVPILHPHGGTFLGLYLWVALAEGARAEEPLWLALDIGVAIALQAGWFVALRWILSGSRLRWLLLAALAPATAVAAVWAYLAVIPIIFLIEADTTPETGDWPVACSVPEAAAVGLPTGVSLALERAGEIWIQTGDGGYGVLSMPGCDVKRRDLFMRGAYGSVGYVAPGGAVYFRMDADGDGTFEHWYLDGAVASPRPLQLPAAIGYWTPVVDSASKALAWLETERAERGQILRHAITVRSLPDGPDFSIPLHIDRTGSVQLLELDLAAGRLTVLRNHREIHVFGLDGRPIGEPVRPTEFDHVGANIRLLRGGWVAWDGYRENARYRLAWSLPAGSGRYEIPKGRRITALSVDPAGRYVALSASGNLSIGSVQDSVVVLRVADGAEVWRRYLPRYSRSQVAFLGTGHLAVTRSRAPVPRIDVLAVPGG